MPAAGGGGGGGERGASQNGAGPTAAAGGAAAGGIRAPDAREALAFVRAHSPEGDADLLPGLLSFCERWLEQARALLILTGSS